MSQTSSTPFNIPELLVEILLFLDPRTLTTSAQRVNKQWQATILGSLKLQRALFLQATPGAYERNRDHSPLLKKTFAPWFDDFAHRHIYYYSDYSNGRYPSCYETLTLASAKRRRAFMRGGSSWRHLLVSQPPVRRLGCLMMRPSEWLHNSMSFKVLEFPDGLRMGKLYDLAQKWSLSEELAFFKVFWDMDNTHDLDHLTRTSSPESLEALQLCKANVDIILLGGLDSCRKFNQEKAQVFKSRFTYQSRKLETPQEPTSDSGYISLPDMLLPENNQWPGFQNSLPAS
ncbi:hypothetical protein JX265_004907 [Neoarthrinium moseri]|uniref:F-box domain-containing protein n=1 Tax=Neoarthrinium moseri TaxID=1658444 RepID=A0A9P9WQ92_9PEZI|nr:uncharacterized protein JN550_011890 [Neoarthrinium moseri]KAI1850899.1 hypothetical protein JX266_003564 [Neoarthrinium moseri]KAI1859695.1 hypothetical protein JN550_011890 [Neoarthrinium moseri]KAI1874699.1 hypothetical protein JX265_004907 [Neoarthrinium moseri]